MHDQEIYLLMFKQCFGPRTLLSNKIACTMSNGFAQESLHDQLTLRLVLVVYLKILIYEYYIFNKKNSLIAKWLETYGIRAPFELR